MLYWLPSELASKVTSAMMLADAVPNDVQERVDSALSALGYNLRSEL